MLNPLPSSSILKYLPYKTDTVTWFGQASNTKTNTRSSSGASLDFSGAALTSLNVIRLEYLRLTNIDLVVVSAQKCLATTGSLRNLRQRACSDQVRKGETYPWSTLEGDIPPSPLQQPTISHPSSSSKASFGFNLGKRELMFLLSFILIGIGEGRSIN